MKKAFRFKWVVGQVVFLLFLCTRPLFAHPPTDMKLAYDTKKSLLHIEMTHVTSNMNKHYIRRIEIFKNGNKEKSMTIVKQATPSGHTEDVAFTAVSGDTIFVEAFSTGGGTGQATLVIPKGSDSQSEKNKK